MTDAATVYRAGWSEGLRPDPRLTVSEWADRYRELSQQSSAEAWRWDTGRTPYLRAIMDALSPSSPIETVIFMKGSQLGGTEAGNNWLGYVIHQAPGPMLYVQPTVEMVKRTSKQRIAHMIEACPALRERVRESRSRDSGNTILAKEFPGGILVMTGANSAVGLRSMPARYLFMDEIDAFDSDVEEEGDPVELARRRTSNFRRNRKIFLVSTPKLKGISRIERAFLETDQRYYHVPCPYCGVFQPITWSAIQWPEGEPRLAAMKCQACERLIQEGRKTEMLAAGEWVPTATGDGRTVGFHLSGLYSPLGWYSWADAATEFLKAKAAGREELKVWVNTVIAETWEEDGDAVDETSVAARAEDYPARVPAGGLVLTAGADIQDDRIEVEVVAWGPGEESWGVEYRVIRGDTSRGDVWERFGQFLDLTWQHEHGFPLAVQIACVDSGHRTREVYRFCQSRKGRAYAVKGSGAFGTGVLEAPRKKRTGRGQRHVELWVVGDDQASNLVHSRLKIEESGPGYCHFPAEGYGYDRNYFAQITSMKAQVRAHRGLPRREWVLIKGRRNEAFDARKYALAALYILNPDWVPLAANRQRWADQVAGRPPAAPEEPTAPPAAPPSPPPQASAPVRRSPFTRRRGGGNWVSGWRS
jgi:phage terminase large subunit GpA-like protein